MLIPKPSGTYDESIAARLQEKIGNKIKLLGSLGRLESLALQIGLIQKTCQPQIIDPCILVFAGDHGVAEDSDRVQYGAATWQRVDNLLAQVAAVNVFAQQNECWLQVVDAGVNYDFGLRENLVDRKLSFGTRNFLREPAMTSKKCETAISYGMALVAIAESNVIGFGGIGVGSSISAAALMHKLTFVPIPDCVGAGDSADNAARSQKIVQRAVLRHAAVNEPFEVLTTFGGFEIAMMVGAMLKAAELRRVMVIDGFVVASALLLASKLEPHILDYCVFADHSEEKEYRLLLDLLKASPLLSLDMRKGEGSGAALAMPLLHAAVGLLNDMAWADVSTVMQTEGSSDDVVIKVPRKIGAKASF